MKDAASRYRFQAAEGAGETHLIPDPILRWSNPVAQEDDAGLFLWTRQGRPEAAAQFFVRKNQANADARVALSGLEDAAAQTFVPKNLWMHEFQSLSESPFTVDWSGQTIWAPRQAGLNFHVEPDSRPPDSSATRRLRRCEQSPNRSRRPWSSSTTRTAITSCGSSPGRCTAMVLPKGKSLMAHFGLLCRAPIPKCSYWSKRARARSHVAVELRGRGNDFVSRASEAQRKTGLEGRPATDPDARNERPLPLPVRCTDCRR